MNFLPPFHGTFPITQTFQEHNQRRIQNGWKYYNGAIDYGMNSGTPLYATMDGKAEWLSDPKGYGNHVRLTNGIWTVIYGHMMSSVIKNGQMVRAGDLIGHSDNTGNSTGPHLHFEIRKNGVAVDPAPLLAGSIFIPTPPTIIPPQTNEPKPPSKDFKLPPIPDIPKARVCVTGPLNIREAPVSGSRAGALFEGDDVPVLDTYETDDDVWLQIGYKQWIAGWYDGEPFVEFI